MNKYTDFIYKFKKILILFLIIFTVFNIIGLFRIKLNTDFALFSTNNSIYEERLDDLEDTFGNLNQIILLVEHQTLDDTVFNDLYDIQREIERLNQVLQVQGVAPEEIIINGAPINSLDVPISNLKAYYNSFEEFSPLIEENNTYYSSFTIFIDDEFGVTEINELENYLDSLGYEYYISGDTYNQSKITDYIISILLFLPPIALLTILLIFRWQMGAIKPTILSVLPAGIGSIWTLGIIGWLGNEVSMLTAVVPIFIIVIGSADGLHFMSHFQDSKLEGLDNKIALNKTLKIVGIPMIITTLTSMAGFLSLLSMNTNSIYDLAIFSAVGIFIAGIATWYVLPLILSNNINVLPKKTRTEKKDLSRHIKKLWGIRSIIVASVIIIISVFSQKYINNEFNMLMVYKDYTIVAENAEKIQEVNGGSIPLYVKIELDDSPISIENKAKVQQIANDLDNLEEVNKVVNPYRLFDIMYKANGTGTISNNMVLNQLYSKVSMDENNTVNNLISTDKNVVRLLVFSSDLDNDTLKVIEDYTEQFDNVEITGVQYLLRELNVNISLMQLYSILLALIIVFIMMVVSLRSIVVAFYSLIPIIITTISLYGFLGITGIPLNITTVIIFSITIGVGIDYAVHFSSVFRYYSKEGLSRKDAVNEAYKNSSRPIIANALGISLGLSIMMLSPLDIHLNVSLLMWASMTVSVFVTLTLLPTILKRGKQ